jgi:hypothetical protein
MRVGVPAAVFAAALGAALIMLPSLAAASLSLPDPTTQCSGSLSKNPSEEPRGSIGYKFSCSSNDPDAGAITSYSVIVTRPNFDQNNVNSFEGSPVASIDGAPDPTTSISCGGGTPSDGFNCFGETIGTGSNEGVLEAAPGPIPAGDVVSGAFVPSRGMCKYLPNGAKAGTPAVPRATVELIVSDAPDAAPPVTLSSALATGSPITALPVDALAGVIPSGTSITVVSGSNTQTFVASAEASEGATSISITSATPNFAYPTSSTVTSVIPGAATGLTEDGPFELYLPTGSCPKVANVVPPKKKKKKK